MKKIRLFSTTTVKEIEGSEAELYVNFYLALSKDYIFTFIINAPNKCGQVIFSESERDRREYHAFCCRCGNKND